jgi:hypothetical protein
LFVFYFSKKGKMSKKVKRIKTKNKGGFKREPWFPLKLNSFFGKIIKTYNFKP